MRRTLSQPDSQQQIITRLNRLRPDSKRLWGKMSVGGMLCHLNDAYVGLLARENIVPGPVSWPGKILLRPLALHLPVPWPHGVPTTPEVDQLIGGTPPEDFEKDRRRLLLSVQAFASATDFEGRVHPIFGPLTAWEWMRWGFLHADHHLRQFSS